MKRTPLLLIAILPFMATAAGNQQAAEVDQEKLRSAVPVTEIVGQEVQARDGKEFGEIESVAFKQDGSVAYYVIEPEEMYGEAAAVEGLEPGLPDKDGPGTRDDGVNTADDDLDLDEPIYVEAGKVSFKDGGNMAMIDMETAELLQKRDRTYDKAASEDLLDSTDIVGMQVDLADADSFGEVEDVMIDQEGKQAVALVVDNWDGVNKERRALPAAFESANLEEETIRYDFGKDALSETGNFELEQYMDDM